MWEEASDPVMGKKDKNEERKERILNLTLEIIYLLTGEGYVIPKKKSPTVGLGALHAPGSVIQKENDKKILELISNIIQLLTGEVAIRCEDVSIYFSLEEWEYIKGNKALYREGIKEEEEPQQLRPLGWESDVTSDTATNGGEEEAALWEGGDQSDCSINPLTEQIQGTDTPAPIMGRSLNNSSAGDYTPVVIKEEASSWEEEKPLAEGTQGTDTATLMGRSLNSSGFPKDTAHGTEEESDSWETDHNYCNINTEQPLGTDQSAPTMGCSLNTNSPADYVSFLIKEEVASWEGESQSYYRIHPLPEQIQGTDTPTPIMGCSLNNSSTDNFILNGINMGTASWEGGNQSDYRIVTIPKQVEGTDQATPGGGYTLYNSHADISDYGEGETANDSNEPKGKLRCAVCNKLFISKRTLERHQIVHTGEKPYSCPDCGKRFARVFTLTMHQRTHTGEKPFPCTECGKGFSSLAHMVSHRRIHTGEKPFSCPDCGKSFAHRSTLSSHQKIHTGQKPHACPECGKCFSRMYLLSVHRKTHTTEKHYSCTECGEGFTHPQLLRDHHKIHTGENRFWCPDCGKGFAHRSWLNNHIRTHMGKSNVLPL
ncbi:hypothetical protein XENTR_v10023178 [Xenopus tropicalis]|nr:hypothetical protein XENTR_v10023178 [Xenopus tropicalis]